MYPTLAFACERRWQLRNTLIISGWLGDTRTYGIDLGLIRID